MSVMSSSWRILADDAVRAMLLMSSRRAMISPAPSSANCMAMAARRCRSFAKERPAICWPGVDIVLKNHRRTFLQAARAGLGLTEHLICRAAGSKPCLDLPVPGASLRLPRARLIWLPSEQGDQFR